MMRLLLKPAIVSLIRTSPRHEWADDRIFRVKRHCSHVYHVNSRESRVPPRYLFVSPRFSAVGSSPSSTEENIDVMSDLEDFPWFIKARSKILLSTYILKNEPEVAASGFFAEYPPSRGKAETPGPYGRRVGPVEATDVTSGLCAQHWRKSVGFIATGIDKVCDDVKTCKADGCPLGARIDDCQRLLRVISNINAL
ncbi:hypothetical protein DPMN_053638 [Dreissena polymorpha]|uniref:Uncharacterized protein n=1 Tax=Dreissena polymorpha TaxID=45954 RepID=A0A9D4CLR0_DREPO|nr:hypothetical protein DPMN_053638 [Dreissena polymorpha]